ncbi:hypothetical protein TVAG_076280 [Trichomonas vaginalis G3]|uniref:Tetraspanin family protein n=1 Tax=Trichomonas vaginalis (strain ATCC PRA-98 / G3) TaxID=412133 RepID=A2D9M5_TRIV3|nr:hypothetical protein TVAGG3_0292750 [Trichomonas vaginalis G3]EAY22881.1 hypothetical protein TVAG_076280 [Trichomonas vaginalis G3]KAI5527404.1 hypothetical protein TVAGG3_0292750 [Trichomonas vaginalis G3]|eukprot:XP_001583867.1 hypothetical protein [Trichomonas vaginalis G3]
MNIIITNVISFLSCIICAISIIVTVYLNNAQLFAELYAAPLSAVYCSYAIFSFTSCIGIVGFFVAKNTILSSYISYMVFSAILLFIACIMNSSHTKLMRLQLKFLYSNESYDSARKNVENNLSCCGYSTASDKIHCNNSFVEFCDTVAEKKYKSKLLTIQVLNYFLLIAVMATIVEIIYKTIRSRADNSISDSAFLSRFITVT